MRAIAAIVCLVLLLSPAGAQTTRKTATKKAASEQSAATTSGQKKTEPEESAKAEAKAKTASAKAKSAPSKPSASTPKPKTSEVKSTSAAAKSKTGTAKAPGKEDPAREPDGAGSATKSPKKSVSGKAKSPASPIDKPPQDNAGEEPTRLSESAGPNITLDPEDLSDFDKNSAAVQRLLSIGLDLTRKNLTYRYGSSDPSTGGMDCSGTIYYLLKAAGVKEPPRDSSGLYLWAQREGTLRQVNPTSLDDPSLDDLRPGDLMFWEGTYEVQRDPPISHTMIYLGREKKTGLPVMVGASDGRTYAGVQRNGVSVFDFKLPRNGSAAKFVGYGRIPGLENERRKN